MLALAVVALVWFMLDRTSFGFSLRLTGANAEAARHAGVATTRVTVMALLISGGLAGLAGTSLILGGESTSMTDNFSAGFGFTGIVVALLARNGPWGTIPAALLFAVLRQGGGLMEARVGISSALVLITQGLVILFVAGSQFLFERRRAVRVDSRGGRAGRPLVDVTRGGTLSVGPFDTAWLVSVVLLSTPLVLAATGELMSERGGVLNIGLEGMMLCGAFFSFLGVYLWHNVWLGVLVGMAAGVLAALVVALLCVRLRSDQIVVGVGLNLLALGVTTFTFREVFSAQQEVRLDYPRPVAISVLSELPVIGPAVFEQTLFGYFAFLAVGIAWFTLYRTSFGLAIRSAGEVPAAADTAGVRVNRIRTVGACVAGAMAGAAGAYLSVGRLGLFNEGMTGGRGFLALAAVIFGGWRPLGVMGAALVFGAADALQLRLQSYAAIPRQVWLAIAVVAVACSHLDAPAQSPHEPCPSSARSPGPSAGWRWSASASRCSSSSHNGTSPRRSGSACRTSSPSSRSLGWSAAHACRARWRPPTGEAASRDHTIAD